MNWVDLTLFVVSAFSGLLGFLRGLVREVFGLSAWIAAAIAAIWFFVPADALVTKVVQDPNIARPVAFGAVFLVVLIAMTLVARVVGGAVRRSALGGLDRTLGLVFGLARGAAIAVAAYIIAGIYAPPDQWPPQVLEARSLPTIYQGAVWVAGEIPEPYRPVVTGPAMPAPTHAADLMRANPVGRPGSTLPVR